MFTDYTSDLSAILGASMLGVVLPLAVSAGVFLVGVILLYTIIWRAVRRGLREFHNPK